MFRKKAIDEWALDYWLLQQYAKFCYRLYYRKIEIVNKDNIPRDKPVILAPNHQNALMDAMVLVCNFPFQNVFLARADIFKGKRMIRFLTFLNIMPVYRIRDGIDQVKKNDEVFDKTVTVLHNANNPLAIFPEGNHGDRRRLRPLVKGLFRIALQAQEKYAGQPCVKIIPVGADYGHYQNFRTTLFINVGKPIEVSEFYLTYAENPVNAINDLKDRFAEELGKLMIDIQTEEYYELYMQIRAIYNDDMRMKMQIDGISLADRFKADKKIIKILDDELKNNPNTISQLNKEVLQYQDSLKKSNLRDWVVRKGPFNVAGLFVSVVLKILLLPVFIFGFINNIVPYLVAASRVKKIRDAQFHSSIKWVVGMLVFPIWYMVVGIIIGLFHMPFWLILLYIAVLPFAGLASFSYFIGLKKLRAKIKFSLKSELARNLTELRSSIVRRMDSIVNNHFHENTR